MKKKFTFMAACFMFCFCISATAQNKNYIGLELLGNTGSYYSINLIKDFIREDKKSFFGVRAGLSILPGQESFSERHTEFYFPISLHYAVFNHLEFGLGVTPFIERDLEFRDNGDFEQKTFFRTILVPSIGYRTNFGENWLFKAAITPLHYTEPDTDNFLYAFFGLMLAKRIGN